ncbi:septum formation family protein [Frankia sp. AgB1.9]|nr:septum formation family protein [Frankia sp. AgW1.1]MBL7548429.1 septum formation family protein [Frankia sp. AgB1.9]MBL7623464.1 septum formation family protein [Frankia sp. AgB1.8]
MARRGFTVAAMASPEREPAEHRDPFENLRLDEGFVRAARFVEPSAAERGRTGDRRDPGRCQVVPANRRLPAGMHRMVWTPGPGPRRRRAARVLAFVAVLAGVMSIVITLRHTTNRTPATTPTATGTGRATSTSAPLAPRTASGYQVSSTLLPTLKVGDCVTWALRPGSTGAMVVSCTTPHRAEVVKMLGLAGQAPGDIWPGSAALDSLAATQCAEAFLSYTSHARPDLEIVSSALEPSSDGWNAGTQQLACTAQLPNRATVSESFASLATTPA